jgi:hypothetical protein
MSRVHKLCAALPKLDFEHSTIDPRLPPRQPDIFNPFPRLARELRNKIWQHAAFFPREVRLRTWDWNEHYSEAEHWRAPAILHANREAKEEGFRYYELVYERIGYRPGNSHSRQYPHDPSERFNGQSRGVYVNFEVDIFIHPSIFRSTVEPFTDYHGQPTYAWIHDYNFGKDVIEKIQYLDYPHADVGPFVSLKMQKALQPLAKSALKTFTLVLDWRTYFHPYTSFDECLVLHRPTTMLYHEYIQRMKSWGFNDKQLRGKWVEDVEHLMWSR